MATISGKTVPEGRLLPLDQRLIMAAASGDDDAIREALADGADIHASLDQPLHIACRNGHKSSVELLLDKGAFVNAANDVGLRWAAEKGHRDVVELLLKRGANPLADDCVAFREAAMNGHTDTVKLLLSRGADVHAMNDDALAWAALGGYADTVTALLEHGADIHAKQDIALYYATVKGHPHIMEILIKWGADIHADNERALRDAVEGDHLAEAILLLRQGADPQNAGRSGPFGYQKVAEWLGILKEAAAEHFESKKPSREECFVADQKVIPQFLPRLHERVLDACATGQFASLVGAPLAASADEADRELFMDIWKALPRDWQNQNQGIYMEFTKTCCPIPAVGSHTAPSRQAFYGAGSGRAT